MRLVSLAWTAVFGGSLLCAASATARADAGAPLLESADMARARELFEEGKRLMHAGDCERALDRFRASRELHAGVGNTRNTAYCLGELDRWDEALEMYVDLLARFGAELDADTRSKVARYMTLYRRRVGMLDVSCNVDGQLLVDGRLRGRLPLTGALRLLPGSHLVRIVKGGYASYEATVTVAIGRTTTLDAALTPLLSVGTLRVEVDPRGALAAGGTLVIDGSPVGRLPWEGNLAPGPHVLFASSGDAGSDLVRVVVVESQRVSTRLAARSLGAPARIRIEPRTAQISIDGIAVGRGGFEGRLPLGDHEVVVLEEGYTSARFTLRSTRESGGDRRVVLAPDPTHPRWRRPVRFHLEVAASPLVAASFRSDLEARAGGGPAGGGLFSARVGLELPMRLALDVSGGWLGMVRSVRRSVVTTHEAGGGMVAVRWDVEDALRVMGPFAAIGARQRIPFGGDRFDLRIGLAAAIALLWSRDLSSTTATSMGASAAASTMGNGAPSHGLAAFLDPEIDLRYRLRPVEIGVGLGSVVFLTDGPAPASGVTRIAGSSCPGVSAPADVRCAPATSAIQTDHAFGRLVAWAPRITLGWMY